MHSAKASTTGKTADTQLGYDNCDCNCNVLVTTPYFDTLPIESEETLLGVELNLDRHE